MVKNLCSYTFSSSARFSSQLNMGQLYLTYNITLTTIINFCVQFLNFSMMMLSLLSPVLYISSLFSRMPTDCFQILCQIYVRFLSLQFVSFLLLQTSTALVPKLVFEHDPCPSLYTSYPVNLFP